MQRELDLREVIRKLNTSKYSGLARVYVCFSSEQIQGNETLRETCIVTCKGKKTSCFLTEVYFIFEFTCSVVTKNKRFSVVISF